MNNPRNLLRNSAAAVQLCFLLARRARSYFSTSINAIQNDGGNANLVHSTSEEDEVKEQSFIDYSVLPLEKKTEKDAAHHRQDVSRKQICENGITKGTMTLHLVCMNKMIRADHQNGNFVFGTRKIFFRVKFAHLDQLSSVH